MLPFGLVNAPATFQQVADQFFAEKLDVFATVYLDNILIFSKNEQNHAKHLRWVLSKLYEHKLKAKHEKSALGLAELQYLGHII